MADEEEQIISPLTEKDLDDLKKAFNKYDKRKTGSINPVDIADVFRMAGQNPTNETCNKMIEEANSGEEQQSTGMLMFSEFIPIVEKYWRSYENYAEELKEACLAFDRNDMGVMEFEELKDSLMKYGEQLDEDEMDIFERAMNVNDGKIIVDEFIKMFAPQTDAPKKKKKGAAKKGKEK